jgi:hypothetical protein
MPIPLSQLDTWSHPGAIATSQQAYASIKHALTKAGSPLASRNVEIFLQGSYANATNIYADSDIDVVVLHDNFHYDTLGLTPAARALHDATYKDGNYNWWNLRDDTLNALRSHYGNSAVTQGTRAIKVATGAGRMTADVLPAMKYRRYATFAGSSNYTGWFGIQFFDASFNAIVNYPKQHIKNGEEKNQASRTAGLYKPTIRVFKNLRNHLVDNGLLGGKTAPSYFLEGALSNVPDDLFIGTFDKTVPAILNHLVKTPNANFVSQNGIVPLFGSSSTQWSQANLATFAAAAVSKWNRG